MVDWSLRMLLQVTAAAWPGHPEFLAQLNAVMGVRVTAGSPAGVV
jgi:hypothetical protein